jgi:hypothetical protein
MPRTHRLVLAILTGWFALCGAAVAEEYSCTGQVTGGTIAPNGIVSVSGLAQASWPYICDVNGTSPNGVTRETCRSILALLLSAQASRKSVQIWYDDVLSCTTRPSRTWMRWHWGPTLLD